MLPHSEAKVIYLAYNIRLAEQILQYIEQYVLFYLGRST